MSGPSWKAPGTAKKGATVGSTNGAAHPTHSRHARQDSTPGTQDERFHHGLRRYVRGCSRLTPVARRDVRDVPNASSTRKHIFIQSGARRHACASRLGRWDLVGRRHRRCRGCTTAHNLRLAHVLGLERRDRTSRVRAVKAPPCHRSIAPRRRASKISRGIRRAAPRRASARPRGIDEIEPNTLNTTVTEPPRRRLPVVSITGITAPPRVRASAEIRLQGVLRPGGVVSPAFPASLRRLEVGRGAQARALRTASSPRTSRPLGADAKDAGKGQKVMVIGGDGYCGWATALHLSTAA